MDALAYHDEKIQYYKESIDREITKCFAGYSCMRKDTIATGHWGCGAFKGDKQIKCKLILFQML